MKLRKEIEEAINRNSAENCIEWHSGTLAEFLTDCLAAFDRATKARPIIGRAPVVGLDDWKKSLPGGAVAAIVEKAAAAPVPAARSLEVPPDRPPSPDPKYTLGGGMDLIKRGDIWVVSSAGKVQAKTAPGSHYLIEEDMVMTGSWLIAAQNTLNLVFNSHP